MGEPSAGEEGGGEGCGGKGDVQRWADALMFDSTDDREGSDVMVEGAGGLEMEASTIDRAVSAGNVGEEPLERGRADIDQYTRATQSDGNELGMISCRVAVVSC